MGLEALAMQSLGTAIDSGLGLILGGINDRRQVRQEGRLLEQQAAVDRKQTAFNQALGLETWKQTGPQALTAELKSAGLSPALQYGGGAAGGGTTGGGSSGVNASPAPSGGGEIIGLAMAKAQIQLMQAQTEKTRAEAAKTAGVDTYLTNQQARMTNIQANLAAESYEETYERIINEAKIVANEAEISGATKDEEIAIMEGELIGLGIANEAKKAGIKLTEEQIKQTSAEVKQAWEGLSIQRRRAIIEGDKLALDKFVRDVPDSIKLAAETVGDVVKTVINVKQARRPETITRRETYGRGYRTTTQTKRH